MFSDHLRMLSIAHRRSIDILGCAQDVFRCSQMFKDVFRCSQIFLDVHRCFWVSSTCSLDVLRMFSGYFHEVHRMFSGCFQDVLRMFSLYLKDTLVVLASLALLWSKIGCSKHVHGHELSKTC